MPLTDHSGWYLADLILRFDVEGEPGSAIHINSVLVAAASDEAAYDKALHLGREWDARYKNTEGQAVSVTFVGLRNLFYIYDGLHDGSEVAYEELSSLNEAEIASLAKEKSALAAFTTEDISEHAGMEVLQSRSSTRRTDT